MAVTTELQPIIDALIKSNKDAADRIIFNENKTSESIKQKLEAVDNKGNLKIQGELRKSLEFEQKQIEETKKNREIAEKSINLEKQNIELMKQANAKVQKTIEDNGGKVEDNTGFLQNQVEIAKAELDLRKKQIDDPTPAQMLSIGRDELELEKLRFKAEGKRAEDNLDFQKKTNELRKAEARERLQQEGLSASAQKEAAKDLRSAQIEGLKLALDPVISPLKTVTGLFSKTLSSLGISLPGFSLGKLAGIVAVGLLIKFLRSDAFKDLVDLLVDFDMQKLKDLKTNLKFTLGALAGLATFFLAKNFFRMGGKLLFLGGTFGFTFARVLKNSVKNLLRILGLIAPVIDDVAAAAAPVSYGGAFTRFGMRKGSTIKFEGREFVVQKGGQFKEIVDGKIQGKFTDKQTAARVREGFKLGTAVQEANPRINANGTATQSYKDALKNKQMGGVAKFLGSAFVRNVPILSAIFTSGMAANILLGDKTRMEKIDAMGELLGSTAGSTILGLGAGAITAATGVGLPFAIPTGLAFAIAGGFAGAPLGRVLMRLIMGMNSGDIPVGVGSTISEGGGIDPKGESSTSPMMGVPMIDLIKPNGFNGLGGNNLLGDGGVKLLNMGLTPTASSAQLSNAMLNVMGDVLINAARGASQFGSNGSFAVVNAITTNDNKQTSNQFGMVYMKQQDEFVNQTVNSALI